MKKLCVLILFFGVHFAIGAPGTHTLYVIACNPIIKPPTKADVQYELFKEHLGLIESSGRYDAVNQIGCMGKYQIAPATLAIMGYNITPDQFKANPSIFPPAMQDYVLNELIQRNLTYLKDYYIYIGQVIKGARITKAGLIGACHLGGIGGVKRFLTTDSNPSDCNGASIQRYLTEFANYNI